VDAAACGFFMPWVRLQSRDVPYATVHSKAAPSRNRRGSNWRTRTRPALGQFVIVQTRRPETAKLGHGKTRLS
jgi:hypothetical protein